MAATLWNKGGSGSGNSLEEWWWIWQRQHPYGVRVDLAVAAAFKNKVDLARAAALKDKNKSGRRKP